MTAWLSCNCTIGDLVEAMPGDQAHDALNEASEVFREGCNHVVEIAQRSSLPLSSLIPTTFLPLSEVLHQQLKTFLPASILPITHQHIVGVLTGLTGESNPRRIELGTSTSICPFGLG
jgi:hypothetical protein